MKEVTRKFKEDKINVTIFPEGHRNSQPHLLEFKKGAFHLASDAGVPILPIVIETYFSKLMECNFPWNRRLIKMRILDPIDMSNIKTKEQINEITIKTRDLMEKNLHEINKLNKDF